MKGHKIMKKILKRFLVVILSIAMVPTLMPNVSAFAKSKFEVGVTKEYTCQKSDGDYLYKIQVSEDKLSFQLDMTNPNTDETTSVIYDQGIATTYKIISKNVLGIKTTNKKQVSKVDYNESIKMAENSFSTQAYREETACIIPTLGGNHLWYRMGITDPDVGYMRMGCDWTYRVPANACTDCSTFRNKIIESNNYFISAGLSDAMAMAVCIAILAGGISGGLTTALAFGLAGTSALSLVSACSAEIAAHDSYDIAKGYGVPV
ncbi:MAG: hypothetical protein K0R92_3101 [Lachnospiraceae bacterium]|jgi:hypothetical protein|nr:hypothetical protein [Lachnospiraceae bacterium]